jgi:hypothetical protein
MDFGENSESQSFGPPQVNSENQNFEEGLLELDASVRPQKHIPTLSPFPTATFGSSGSVPSPVTSPRSKQLSMFFLMVTDSHCQKKRKRMKALVTCYRSGYFPPAFASLLLFVVLLLYSSGYFPLVVLLVFMLLYP